MGPAQRVCNVTITRSGFEFRTQRTEMNKQATAADHGTSVQAPEPHQRGTILASPVEEEIKSTQGRKMVRERVISLGRDSLYNLTGLSRSFPLDSEDLPGLSDQFSFYAYHMGGAEELAISLLGGDPQEHGAVLCTRVTSGMLAVMLALVEQGDRVLSFVQRPRSHPSVQQAVEMAGGDFYEAEGLEALQAAVSEGPWKLLAITPLTPTKHHIPAADVGRAIVMAKEAGLLVVSDDAHMVSRCAFYQEPPAFELGDIDVALWSTDKHSPGPRGATIVGRAGLMERIQARVFQLGVEAQSGHYVAMHRSMEALDTAPVEEASRLAREAFDRFRARYGDRVYQAGPGVAISTDDFEELVLERAEDRHTPLVASEVSTTASFILMRDHGIATLALTEYPGAAPTFRLMMYPDGSRLGLDRLEQAVEATLDATAAMLERPDEVRALLLGES